MSQLYIAQKVFSLGGRFAITDADQQPRYYVAGSFMQIPKTFAITDVHEQPVAEVTKTVMSLMPRFTVMAGGAGRIEIRKEFTFFKPKYTIEGSGLSVEGDWWDLNFSVSRQGQEVARIRRKLLSWADTYSIDVADDSLDVLMVALVVAIDRVRADESSG